MRVKISVLMSLAIMLLIGAACVTEPTAQKVTYAYLPQYSKEISLERHQDIVAFIKKETGLDIIQVFPESFDDHMKKVGSGEIDISFSNPFVYIKIAQQYDARAFGRIIEKEGKDMFRGEICVLKDSPLQTLADLKGKRVMAVSPSSAGGYLFQRGMLVEAGIDPNEDLTIDFAQEAGKQEKAFLAMYSGEYDACFVREGTRTEVMKDQVDISKVRVLAYTPWYSGWVYATRKGLDPVVLDKIRSAMLKLDFKDPEDKVILEKAKFVKIVSSEDKDFNSIRELATKLKLKWD
ncbi:MAG: phosphate/phosphite/phosphonate ABC transporter substrate-binding protein [Candidatus Aminicenantes bacterium]|nr:phosphate/phosphite/phosphonate ABC transporter substrate-binding protein [Candidatus Aminicenantes bacterium]